MELKITSAKLHINPNCLSVGDNSGIWLYIYIYCKSPKLLGPLRTVGVRYFKLNATNLLDDEFGRSTLMLCYDQNLKSVKLSLTKWQKYKISIKHFLGFGRGGNVHKRSA